MLDILILVADKNMQAVAEAVLQKFRQVEQPPTFTHRCVVHPNHDPGVLRQGVAYVQPFQKQYHYALLLLDHEGCGREATDRDLLEQQLEAQLATVGWADRSAAVVIAPELEQWIWLGETHLAQAIDWPAANGSLYQWLEAAAYKEAGNPKPARPKEALHAALRQVRLPPSSAILADIVTRGSYRRCTDPAFLKLLARLRQWFGG